jgi:hypothetical protein
MALFDRLTAHDDTKIPVHTFMACVSELIRGTMTTAEIETALSIPSDDQHWLGLQTKVGSIGGGAANKLLFTHELEQVLILAESGIKYTTAAAARTRLS